MPCTTILVGKNASNDRSTMISRTDDGHFDVKKMVVVEPRKQPRKYKSVLSHVEIALPDNPMRYTACPSVDRSRGIWAATGINAANVGMTATETITSNPRVLAADPLVEFVKAKKRGEKDSPGGIGEEDIVVLVLPYISSAREGVLRLAELLEKYGTYESNGIAFNDVNEVWWMETIGGHHWMARRVPDDVCVINPNQFGMDSFDLDDAFGAKKDHMCSADLREFIADNCLDLNQDGSFNPRDIFGSHSDMDHIYNTPRAWMMGRYLAPHAYRWDGPEADFTPESDDIPWCFVPERKLAAEDVKYMLSMHYQGTIYNPYSSYDSGRRGMYRSIGINRTGVTSICQIRENVPDCVRGIEWVCFGSTTFSAMLPVYTNVSRLPKYLSDVSTEVSTDNLYWASRLIGAMADHDYPACIQHIERYQNAVTTKGRRIVLEYDGKIGEAVAEKETAGTDKAGKFGDGMTDMVGKTGEVITDKVGKSGKSGKPMGSDKLEKLIEEANDKLCAMAKEQTTDALGKVLNESSQSMKNGFKLSDN
jgi:dipeptidase